MHVPNANQVRIIGGTFRGRKLHFSATQQLRPTPDRVRETLFNWLRNQVLGARCLDLFAGSGALSFEALSRGASFALIIDHAPVVIHQLRHNLNELKIKQAHVLRGCSPICLQKNKSQPFDIVFVDPPFGQNLITPCLRQLGNMNYLAEAALVYVESELSKEDLLLPNDWVILKHKLAGHVNYYLLSYQAQG